MQQYKYIKGSAADFVGAPSWAASRAMVDHDSAFVDSKDSRYIYIDGSQCGEEFRGKFISWDWGIRSVSLIAQREPITEWSGDGLPPVGVECEYTKNSLPGDEWTVCVVDYVGSSFVVYRDCYGVELTGIICDIKFRPLRNEAERKREEVVNAISEICRSSASNGHSGELIYDAIASGKIPGVKLD